MDGYSGAVCQQGATAWLQLRRSSLPRAGPLFLLPCTVPGGT